MLLARSQPAVVLAEKPHEPLLQLLEPQGLLEAAELARVEPHVRHAHGYGVGAAQGGVAGVRLELPQVEVEVGVDARLGHVHRERRRKLGHVGVGALDLLDGHARGGVDDAVGPALHAKEPPRGVGLLHDGRRHVHAQGRGHELALGK